jgi:hypothetical protein
VLATASECALPELSCLLLLLGREVAKFDDLVQSIAVGQETRGSPQRSHHLASFPDHILVLPKPAIQDAGTLASHLNSPQATTLPSMLLGTRH